MRRYHRWLAPVFAIFFLWIAVTGLTIQFIRLSTPPRPQAAQGDEEAAAPAPGNPLIPAAQAHEADEHKPAAAIAAPAKPETEIDRIRRERQDLSEFVMALHSGERFGPVGTWLSILSGFVLIFLALSGLTMYIQMYRRRTHRHSHPKRIFW